MHRIALFTVALDNVGPSRAMVTLAEGLDRSRFTPHLVTAVAPSPHQREQVRRLNVPFAALDASSAFDPRAIIRLARLLRAWRIDLVHARLQRAGFLARMAAPLAGRPAVLVNVVNIYGHHFSHQHGSVRGALLRALDVRTTCLVDRWVANSRASAAQLQLVAGVRGDRISVIHNAIEHAGFTSDASVRDSVRRELGVADKFVIGTVSRLVPLKRVELIIESVCLSRAIKQPHVLLVVGDGPSRSDLEAAARRAGVHAIFTGARTDVPRLLSAMDMFIFASESEGQPNAILEAMAAGQPVVAVNIPAVAEVIVHGETGWLVGADARALARAIERLAVDPACRSSLGMAAQAAVADCYSPVAMVEAFELEYDRTIAERRRS